MSLYGAFSEARSAAQASHPDQTPWLDDNGDGQSNDTDGEEAQQRGFAFAGTLAKQTWPPYIVQAEVAGINEGEGLISARVEDDQGIISVWAVIYSPEYTLPDEGTEEMPLETLPTVTLLDPDGDGTYSALYQNFDEIGEYRVVVYAVDVEYETEQPKQVHLQTGHKLFLPTVTR